MWSKSSYILEKDMKHKSFKIDYMTGEFQLY